MRGRREENRGGEKRGEKVNSQNRYEDSNLRLGVLYVRRLKSRCLQVVYFNSVLKLHWLYSRGSVLKLHWLYSRGSVLKLHWLHGRGSVLKLHWLYSRGSVSKLHYLYFCFIVEVLC